MGGSVVSVVARFNGERCPRRNLPGDAHDRFCNHVVSGKRGRKGQFNFGFVLRERIGPGGGAAVVVRRNDFQRMGPVQQLHPLCGGDVERIVLSACRGVGTLLRAVDVLRHGQGLPAVFVRYAVTLRERGGLRSQVGICAADNGRMVVYHRPRRAGVVGAFRARAVIRLDAVRNRGPAERDCVGVTAVDALVYLRPCAAVDLPFEDIAGKIAVVVRGSPPTDRQAFAAANVGRNRDGRGLRGGAVPNDRVCAVGIRAVRYQDFRFDITKRANTAEAAERAVVS